jgi:hypothetical protein
MRITIPALLVLSLLVLPLPVGVQAQNPATQLTYPFNATETNPCTGEVVQLTGEGHIVMHFTVDNAGGIHVVDITNTMGPLQGVALITATVYKSNQTVSSTINDNGPTPQFEFTFVMSEVLISQGSTPNFVVHTTIHATVSSNALVTAQVLNSRAECSGQT